MKIVFVTDDSTMVTEIEIGEDWGWDKSLGWTAMANEIKEALLWTSNVEAAEKSE